jgi:pyrroline-5-carboxylate reductase
MQTKSFGFIGGGRVTRILLSALKNAYKMPERIVVSDISREVLDQLKKKFPEVEVSLSGNKIAASQDIVFLSVHSDVIGGILNEIKSSLKPEAIIISLAPKFTISQITQALGGFEKIVRLIPNAPSVINKGYNACTIPHVFSNNEFTRILNLFDILGKYVEVDEEKLDAYAVLTGMGPTYLWFQLYELEKVALSFGLEAQETRRAIMEMVSGTVKTMFTSGLTSEEVMDLIPVKPLAEEEEKIKAMYDDKLKALYHKLKNV